MEGNSHALMRCIHNFTIVLTLQSSSSEAKPDAGQRDKDSRPMEGADRRLRVSIWQSICVSYRAPTYGNSQALMRGIHNFADVLTLQSSPSDAGQSAKASRPVAVTERGLHVST